MTDYISKKGIQKALIDLPADLDAKTVQRCIEAAHNFPAADVRENKHGKWIKYPSGELICSECCHRRVKDALGYITHWFALPKFCEVCGAIMDGGDEQ